MMTLRDIIFLNMRRAGKKKTTGKKKYLVGLFSALIVPVLLINIGYGITMKTMELVLDDIFPHPSLLVVHKNEDYKGLQSFIYGSQYLSAEEIGKVEALHGVEAVQEEFYMTGGHYFDLERATHVQPVARIAGYNEMIFDLYSRIPPGEQASGAIPILIYHDAYSLTYYEKEDLFFRQGGQEREKALGKTFTGHIRPLCSGNLRWGAEEFSKIFSNPALMRESLKNKRLRQLARVEEKSPDQLKYCRSLTLRFQIAGFIRDRLILSEGTHNLYGVVPIETARQIKSYADSGKKPQEQEPRMLYLLAEKQRQAEIIDSLEAMGLFAETRESLKIKQMPSILKELRGEKTLFIWAAFFALFILLTYAILIYQVLGAKVRDSIREIGVMRCLGATRKDIRKMFLYLCIYDVLKITALSLFLVNFILLLAGYKTAGLFNVIPGEYMEKLGGELMPMLAGVESFTSGWLIAPLWMQAIPLLSLIPATFLAAWLPTRKASRVDPVVAMRD